MSISASSSFGRGILKIKNNPQLFYTIVVALLVAAAFVLMSQRFVSIATSAEERLINVRVGSLQDAFASFAGDHMSDTAYLNTKINEVLVTNETIVNFRIIAKEVSADTADVGSKARYVVLASNDLREIGTEEPSSEFLYTLASNDPTVSITSEFERNGERLFNTARAITDASKNVLAVIMTTQTLSVADRAIQESIANSMILLAVVLVFIMLLFLRHSRIIDYTVLYSKLKEVDKLKDDFLSMASHELRTPLSIIREYAGLIKADKTLSADSHEIASRIDNSAKDLDLLVADILDVNRIEQGRINYHFERLDPSELVQSVVLSVTPLARDKGLSISLENNLGQSDSAIYVDKDHLRQILINVIGNAVKYTMKGEIKVRQYVEGAKLLIRVSDTGVGIGAGERKRLFEKFYRIRTAETKDVRGTGLGLWIVAQLVKEMRGEISVESIKGVGSHFIISFPLATSS